MAYNVPEFRTIRDRVLVDLGGVADGTAPRRSVENVLAFVLARCSKGLYGFLAWALKQVFPDTAEELYFWRWAAKFGITQKPAVPWEGTYTFTGVAATVVPDNTEVQRSDGQLYITDGPTTIGGDPAVLIAQEASADSNCDAGQTLSLTSPVANVDTDGTVVGTTTIGADVETKDEGLDRLLARLANPPRGGGPGDYKRWAKEVPGVTRAWEFRLLEGPNSVSVAFARDGDVSPVPDSGARAAVLAYLVARAPITSTVYVITLVAAPLDLTFTALDPNTAGVGTAISESVAALLLREGAPGTTLPLSHVDEAVSDATGEISHTMSVPSAAMVYLTNQLPVIGTVTRP